MNSSGISLRIINLASALVGHVRGGLAMVNVVDSMFFAEISGSAVADVAAIEGIQRQFIAVLRQADAGKRG